MQRPDKLDADEEIENKTRNSAKEAAGCACGANGDTAAASPTTSIDQIYDYASRGASSCHKLIADIDEGSGGKPASSTNPNAALNSTGDC